jgi:2-dehydro-3-deoxyphosphogluconate aldolase/(4S)-4-hydroxy-2-oxoglutarate aldolase
MVNTHSRQGFVASIEAAGVVAVVRLPDANVVRDVAAALVAGGVRFIEITMTVPRAVELIEELAGKMPSGVVIGAGTVLTSDAAEDVIAAGAAFVVSPIFDRKVIDTCHRHDVVVMPGGMTPTEIHAAWSAGADIVKVFPATSLGPSFFKDVRGPLPQVRLMPTGGVSCDNAGDWIRAGAVAVGVGTALVDPKAVLAGNLSGIIERAQRITSAVANARGTVMTRA